MNGIELVQSVAAEFGGKTVCNESAEYILFEHTGFPSFFNMPDDGETPEDVLRYQLRRYFAWQPLGENRWPLDPTPAPATKGAGGS